MPVTIHKEYRHYCLDHDRLNVTIKRRIDSSEWIWHLNDKRVAYCPECGENLEQATSETENGT